MTIEKALKEADLMVLLESASSMPYRKEVYREWFYFEQNNKPIHPLYLQECELHSRLIGIKYINARNDIVYALSELLSSLER
jgi:hypothetical protein